MAAASARHTALFYAVGAAFLLYLAHEIAAAGPPGRAAGRGTRGGGREGHALGLSLGLANPYQLAWWLTAGLSSINSFGVAWAAGLFAAIATWIVAFPAAVRAGWRVNRGAAWLAIKAFSVVTLAAFGAYFLYTAFESLA